MRGAIAAGHPLTAEAGARVLAGGGNAVDALLAAAFTAFVTEGPLTGPAGGGFLLVHESGGETTLLECFFAVPEVRLGAMEEIVIDFADSGTQVFHVGEGSGAGPLTGTTHVSVVDGAGTAAALSSTLGSGSGVFRAGAQMNNMLGELDVIGTEPRAPGTHLPTMLTPTLVLEDERPRLLLGSAGSVRLAGAIAQVAWRVVRGGMPVEEAIDAPRMHVEGPTLHLEGGWAEQETGSIATASPDSVIACALKRPPPWQR